MWNNLSAQTVQKCFRLNLVEKSTLEIDKCLYNMLIPIIGFEMEGLEY